MGVLSLTLAGMLLVGQEPPAADGVADHITLADGAVVRGLVVDPNQRGNLVLIVRRAWAEAELPDRARAWRAAEAPWMARARAERLTRLDAWIADRTRNLSAEAARTDSLLNELTSEAAHLRTLEPDGDLPPLMMVALPRRDVKALQRRPAATARLLRLGWRARFPEVETMAAADLKSALEGRSLPVAGTEPVALDDLLPTPIETDARWLARRAATEVGQDRTGRFVRYGDLVLPDAGTDAAPNLLGGGVGDLAKLLGGGAGGDLAGLLGGAGGGDLSNLVGSLLGDPAAGAPARPKPDPLEPKLAALGDQGRVGAVLTALEIAPDLSSVQVTSTLLARLGPQRWEPVASRSVTVRPDQLGRDAGVQVGADPQVQSVFRIAESLGLPIDAELKQRSLAIGAATQQALSRARASLQPDLDALALPLSGPR